ncbi:hypothetical protein ACHAXR_011412 [Thalassiosira sp. AJA248-18]
MADAIAKRLLAALASGRRQSSTTPLSESSLADQPPLDKTQNLELEQWSDELESKLVNGIPKFREEDPTITSSTLKEAADKLHTLILTEVAPSFVTSWDNDDAAANQATWAAANSLSPVASMDLWQLASLLRATGLFMRWNAQVLQSPFASIRSPVELTGNQMTRLQFRSMLFLYAQLLDLEIVPSPTTTTTTSTALSSSYPDVPRFASICLFRATYGDDVMSTTARSLFVNSLDGCSYLMKALLKGDQPFPRLFSVVRNIHHLIASFPESIPKMEKALETLTADTIKGDNNQKYGLSEALVATLAWAFRSEPPFPGAQSDRRSELVVEILRAMYALNLCSARSRRPSQDTMTQIGIILCDLLHLSNSDERCYNIKLAAVALLLNAPKEYTEYLVKTGSIKPLVDILSYQTSLVVVERTGNSSEDAAAVVPILLVLLKLTQSNESALQRVKDEVFPPNAEVAFEQRATAELAKGETEGKSNAKNMAPLDAPRGTLRWKIIRLMTWTDSNVKRTACELLWTLCGEDSTRFVLRTGFGNAIYFLGVRGLVNLPEGVEM